MKKLVYILTLIIIIFIAQLFASCKMKPLKLAEHYSGLSLPKSARIDSLVDLENERGERVLFIKIKFAEKDGLILTKEVNNQNFNVLPIDEDIVAPEQNGIEILKYLSLEKQKEFLYTGDKNQQFEGFYRIKKDNLNRKFEIVIIDELKSEIIIYILVL